MINKLLDETYWNELPEMMKTLLGNKKFYMSVDHSLIMPHNAQYIMVQIFHGTLYETDEYICADPTDAPAIPDVAKLWSDKDLTAWLDKNILLVKERLLDEMLYLCGVHLSSFRDASIKLEELKKENNLNNIFLIYLKLRAKLSNKFMSPISEFDFCDATPVFYSPSYTRLTKKGDWYSNRESND